MAREKQLHRITTFIDPETDTIVRSTVEYRLRIVDDVTGKPDEDMGKWQNGEKDFSELKPAAQTYIQNIVKQAFGIV